MSDEIKTIDPDIEPEYVGVHSAIVNERCEHYNGETLDDVERCDAEATNTVVMFHNNRLAQIASCDECGEPEDVDRYERQWTGEVFDPDPTPTPKTAAEQFVESLTDAVADRVRRNLGREMRRRPNATVVDPEEVSEE